MSPYNFAAASSGTRYPEKMKIETGDWLLAGDFQKIR
jgi:hypothetical protein